MTRPRPPIGPALAGAFDLSSLKQQPPTAPAATAGATGSAPVGLEISEANLETEVLARSNEIPVVVLLWTPRSDASVQLGDVLAALAKADGGSWALTTVNVDTAPRVAQVFGVQAVPTVVAIASGQPISSFEGVQPPEQLRRWLDSLLSATAGKLSAEAEAVEEADPELERARALWDDSEFDDALAAYETILEARPNHAEAKDALRQIAFLKRATTQPADAVATADAAPDDIDAAFAAADVEVALDAVVEAFTRLTGLVRRTAGDERAAVRTRLVELFELFPTDDPRVVAGRRNLANALY